MEKLFELIVLGFVLIAAVKVLVFWTIQKLLHPTTPTKRTKVIGARAEHTSKMFNELLKNKKLDYACINSIYQILKKYASGQKYQNNIHLIYSTLKHAAIRNQDLANIQLILDCARSKAK